MRELWKMSHDVFGTLVHFKGWHVLKHHFFSTRFEQGPNLISVATTPVQRHFVCAVVAVDDVLNYAPWLASLLNLRAKCFEFAFQLKTALLRFHDGPPVKASP